jgi:hypothetical protein
MNHRTLARPVGQVLITYIGQATPTSANAVRIATPDAQAFVGADYLSVCLRELSVVT